MTRGKKSEDEIVRTFTGGEAIEPEIHKGTLLDGTEIEYVVDVDGVMSCVSPPSVAGMALTRRNDGGKDRPGSLKLVGKPRKG